MPEPRTGPFVHRRRPRWSETDAARIVYTVAFPEYGMEAIEAWFRDRVGAGFYEMNLDWNVGTPFVHLSCDFRAPATPRDELLIEVRPERIGETSLAFRVLGRRAADGATVFEGRYVCVCVRADALRPIPLDPRIRAAAEADLRPPP